MSEDAIKILYSYSRKDLDMRNALEDHLSALREAGKISTWHDLELEAGTEWEPAILHKLDTADIILLLISSSFIASKYCYGTELNRAIARHDAGTARVIPIILRPCDWNHSYVPFSKLNVLPTHAKPITQWEDRDAAFAIVAQRIREAVDQLNAQKLQHVPPADIATLKNAAYRAERNQDWDLAQRLWLRVDAAASGQDAEAIEALQSLSIHRHTRLVLPQSEPPQTAESSKASSNPTISPKQDTAKRSTPITPINSASTNRPATLINKAQLNILQAAIDAEEANPSIAITEHHIAEKVDLTMHEIRANLRLMERQNCVQLQNLSTFNREAVWVKVTPEGYMALQGRNEFLNSTNPTIERIDKKIDYSTSFAPARFATDAELAQLVATTSFSTEDDDLNSERFGANYYAKLRDLLKVEDWKAADEETAERMCEVMDRQEENWLRADDIKKFSCQDFQNIDRLWVKYSNGKFGFSVQKKIYLEFGAKVDGNYPGDEIWNKFGDQSGWRVSGSWIHYKDITFNASAPLGHLPCRLWFGIGLVWLGSLVGRSFFSRAEACKL